MSIPLVCNRPPLLRGLRACFPTTHVQSSRLTYFSSSIRTKLRRSVVHPSPTSFFIHNARSVPGWYCRRVETGTLRRVKHGPSEEDEFVVDTKEAGSVTGFLHIMTPGEADSAFATIKAEGDAKVWCLAKEDLHDLLKTNSDLAMGMLASMARELRGQTKALALLTKRASPAGDKKFEGIKMMCYDSTCWVRENFKAKVLEHNKSADPCNQIVVDYTSDTLSPSSVSAAVGYDVVCLFVNDSADGEVLKSLGVFGVRMIALRCAGFDRVDVKAAQSLGLTVARVPAYSPYAVAEHALALMMALNRKVHRASVRTKDANFSLDGMVGFDLHGKSVCVVGCGKIGRCLCNILLGFGVKLLCVEYLGPIPELVERGATFVSLDEAWSVADVVFLQAPLLPSTTHMFNEDVLPKLKKGMALINTSRGGLVDTKALIKGLRSGIVAMAGLDVYENESGYFFRDCSSRPVQDPILAELLSFNNVILTGHQAFFTQEAIDAIVSTTFDNVIAWRAGAQGKEHKNSVF